MGTIFNENADFSNTIFNVDSEFSETIFNGGAYFSNATFSRNSYFYLATFDGYANFVDTKFNGDARFFRRGFEGNGTTFGNADFSNSIFNGTADFYKAKFNGHNEDNDYAKFIDALFRGETYFEDARFAVDTDFDGATFGEITDFSKALFAKYAHFWNTTFNRDAYFSGTIFGDTADFSYSSFQKETTFRDSKFGGDTSFNVSRFKEDALFEGAKFNRTLYLTRTKYDNLYIRWSDINDLAYDDAAYLSLMENFKRLGYLEDYDNCYFAYRKEHREQGWRGTFNSMSPAEEWIRKGIDSVLEISYGYGKKPLNPLGLSIVTILLFGAMWWIGGLNEHKDTAKNGIFEKYGRKKEIVYKNRPQSRDWCDELHILARAIIFSVTVFLSGTRLFINPPDLPKMLIWTKFQTRIVFTAERILGAFFSILLFIALGATIVR